MKIRCDVDGTLCTTRDGDYESAEPVAYMIEWVRARYARGDDVTIWTARGTETGTDWSELTKRQLERWGVPYHRLEVKPFADLYVDDKAARPDEL